MDKQFKMTFKFKHPVVILTLILAILHFSWSQNRADLQKLEDLKQSVVSAKSKNHTKDRIVKSLELIEFLIIKIGDLNYAYREALELEEIIEQHLDNPEVRIFAFELYQRLAFIYDYQIQYEKSLQYANKALNLNEHYNIRASKELLFDIKGRMAYDHYLLGHKEKAYTMLDSILVEANNTEDEDIISDANYNSYCVYVNEDPKRALTYAKNSLGSSNLGDIAHRNINIGTCYLNLNNLDSALYYTIKGKQIADENKFIQQQSNAYNQLREIYAGLGDFERAFQNQKLYDSINDKLGSYRSGMELVSINNEMLNDKIELQNQLAEEKLTNQNLIIWSIITLLIILILSLIYVYNRLKIIGKKNRQIAKEKLRAENSEKHKEQFLANMSHEIRTPMNAISGMINALSRREHPKDQDVYLKSMRNSLDNLLVIVNDILDFSKIESGALEIQSIPMDLREVLDHVLSILTERTTEKSISITTEIEADFPDKIMGDPVRASQIIMNLLGNAIKFTDKGSITIKIRQNLDSYQIIIKDTGVGISSDQLGEIFDSFKQGNHQNGTGIGGTGLGLAITKRLIEIQDGTISVESVVDQGSKFTVNLPLIFPKKHDAIPDKIREDQLIQKGSQLKGLRVLLAEDNAINLMVISDDLKWYIPDVKIDAAKNGDAAIKLFNENIYDIILMDIQMPMIDGFGATKSIRQSESLNKVHKQTPILALTASLLSSQIEKYYKAGMNGYIPKPYTIEELISAITKAVII